MCGSGGGLISPRQPPCRIFAGVRPSAFQVELELQPGSDARRTQQVVRDLSQWLSDSKRNPEVSTSIGYVADGGPRVVLVLNPPLPASNIAYFTVTVQKAEALDTRLRVPARLWRNVIRMSASMRSVFHAAVTMPVRLLTGFTAAMKTCYERLVSRFSKPCIPFPVSYRFRITGARVCCGWMWNQAKARRAGISSEEIATSLAMRNSGLDVSVLRDGDMLVPLVVRGASDERQRPEDLANTLIQSASGGAPVPLSAVAKVKLASEPSTIRRRNLERTLTVQARSSQFTAQQAVDYAAPAVAKIALPAGYRIELGAEIEEAAESNAALSTCLPVAVIAMLILFIWQFGSFRKLALIVGIIPFAMIGAGRHW
jgi:multidrug efflux pump subunit AcrB